MGEKAKWKRQQLGLPAIPEPEIDGVTGEILTGYSIISRSRQFVGMAGVPLPLSPGEIDRYLSSTAILIDRDEFEAAILALDDEWRDEWARKHEEANKKAK